MEEPKRHAGALLAMEVRGENAVGIYCVSTLEVDALERAPGWTGVLSLQGDGVMFRSADAGGVFETTPGFFEAALPGTDDAPYHIRIEGDGVSELIAKGAIRVFIRPASQGGGRRAKAPEPVLEKSR